MEALGQALDNQIWSLYSHGLYVSSRLGVLVFHMERGLCAERGHLLFQKALPDSSPQAEYFVFFRDALC